MIDMHCHILSGLDDGAGSLLDSISMAKAAVEDGITVVLATPHHANGRYQNEASLVNAAVKELNDQLRGHRIPLQVWPGQEIRVNKDLIHDVELGSSMPLHQSRYMLIEFPSDRIPAYIEDHIYELSLMGIIPIIAHPERNQEIIQDPGKLLQLIHLGAMSQITAGSMNGSFGSKIQSVTIKLCEANLVHFIASDAHNTSNRPFGLSGAYQTITDRLGKSYSEYYRTNASAIISNSPIHIWEPIKRKQSIFVRMFNRS